MPAEKQPNIAWSARNVSQIINRQAALIWTEFHVEAIAHFLLILVWAALSSLGPKTVITLMFRDINYLKGFQSYN